MNTPNEAQQYRPGDVVILTQIGGWSSGGAARMGKDRKILADGRFAVALRMGNMGGFSGGCKFAAKARTVEARNIVRLASRREILIGFASAIVPIPGVQS